MEIELEDVPFDLAFHPSTNIVATGLISGHLHLIRHGDLSSEPERLWSIPAHKQSIRGVSFIDSGKSLLTASSDCSIRAINVETGKPVAHLQKAHGNPINRLINLTESTVASGDDDGTIKVWDIRANTCCCELKTHEDYVSDMEFVPNSMQLLATSGDGTLSVYNLRKKKVQAKSEFSEDELLSVVLMKNGEKVVCGSEKGVLLLYSWNCWNDCSDRFVGHSDSVDALLKFDEDILLTGSGDGVIRFVSILPNKMVGVIGEHENYPIENLAFSHDRNVLGSVSHDQVLKLWDIRHLHESNDMEPKEAVIKDEHVEMDLDVTLKSVSTGSGKKRKARGQSSSKIEKSEFFADL